MLIGSEIASCNQYKCAQSFLSNALLVCRLNGGLNSPGISWACVGPYIGLRMSLCSRPSEGCRSILILELVLSHDPVPCPMYSMSLASITQSD